MPKKPPAAISYKILVQYLMVFVTFSVVAVLDMTVSDDVSSTPEMYVTDLLLSATPFAGCYNSFGNHDCGFRELA